MREYVLSPYYVPDAVYFFIPSQFILLPTLKKKKVVSFDLKGLISIRQNNTQCGKQYQEGIDPELVSSGAGGMVTCSRRIGADFTEVWHSNF